MGWTDYSNNLSLCAERLPGQPGHPRAWANSTELLARLPDSAMWLPAGHAPRASELFSNPEFAATLQALAENGYDAFTRGT
jgi:gamma-glutamyltranspeptidase